MRILILSLLMIFSLSVRPQGCFPPIDTLVTEGSCNPIIQDPSIPENIPVTRCFVIMPETQFINLGFIIPQPACGPVSYSYLNYELFGNNCGDLITSGQLFPIPNNNSPILTNYPDTLYLCYTWLPLCTQTSVCATYLFSPLPIELIFFRGWRNLESIQLEWMTATELNNEKFIIERSGDFTGWEKIGEIWGSGNSLSPIKYEFVDREPRMGTNYYRLFQFDFDGGSELVKTIAIYFDAKTTGGSLGNFNILGQQVR
jgi:hypothetical protein